MFIASRVTASFPFEKVASNRRRDQSDYIILFEFERPRLESNVIFRVSDWVRQNYLEIRVFQQMSAHQS
jgi:hypothetical protein